MKTFAIIGGGPSVTQADVDLLRHRCFVIAINDAYRLAPWADVLYACDQKWWTWHKGVPGFMGRKYALQHDVYPVTWPGIRLLADSGVYGLGDAWTLRRGFHSGYQAINLAVHLKATRVLLLGYDLSCDGVRSHWFGDHPDHQPSPYFDMIAAFERGRDETPPVTPMVDALRERGVDVLNCSRRTALAAFPRVPLEAALSLEVAA